jgi:hypothetical protein
VVAVSLKNCFGFSLGFDRLEKRLGLADTRDRERVT